MDFRKHALPVFTNREDFLLPVSGTDDNTGEPLNFAYIETAVPGAAFTASLWDVSVNNLILSSSTTLTIPAYPIGNELLAVTLTVPTGQAVSPGMPVTIVDHATQANSMTGYVTSYASSTGVLVCQIGCSMNFEIRSIGPQEAGTGYVTWYDFGVLSDAGPLLSATLGSGIFITGLGNLLVTIPAAQFRQLNAATYSAALTYTDTVNTRQAFRAPLNVIQGGLS